jgi:spore coat polysaccharide biosynthesis predicted glycosyltransferase SpsG
VHLATTSSNPRLAELRAAAAQDPALQLWVDQPNLAAFHASHDLQVGAGGGALWERCALGVPTLALVCAANQRLSVPWLAEAGVVVGFDALQRDAARQSELGATIARLIAAPAERAALRERSLAWIDGRGAERAATAILALQA